MRQIKYCILVCLYPCIKLRTSNKKENKIHGKKLYIINIFMKPSKHRDIHLPTYLA